MSKRKLVTLISTFALVLIFIPPTAQADSTIKISFVMINPLTGLNAGTGASMSVRAVNRDGGDPPGAQTNSQGVVTFDIKPQQYTLSGYCGVCYSGNQGQFITNYLVVAKSDGTVEVLSADGEPVTKDSSGNWMITTKAVRQAVSNDPWQLMTTKPNLPNIVAKEAWLLTNGKVLVLATGNDGRVSWWTITPDINGNYYDGTWNQIARIPDYNSDGNGAILHSGNFFISGGEANYTDAGVFEENNNRSYVYNVSTNTWTAVTPPNNGQGIWAHIGAPPFVELANGKIMIGNFSDRDPSSSHESMLFDETTMKWTVTGTNKTGMNSEAGFTLLPNDKVLSVNTDGRGDAAEIYDPATELWSKTGGIPAALANGEIGPALTLPNGKTLAQGATGANALYDYITNSWTQGPSFPKLNNGLQLSAPDNPTAILPNGNLLTVTSYIARDTNNMDMIGPARYFEYDVTSNAWLPVIDDLMLPPANSNSTGIKMLPLPNGKVMVINSSANPGSGGIAFYTSSGAPVPSWAPVIDKVSDIALSPGKNYNVSGKQLSGLTQGSQFGDEFENATNYALVRIVNNSSHHVFYATTSNFSNTSIKPMVPSTFNFTIGSDFEDGPSQMYVVANGIASLPIDVNISGGYDKVAADKAVADKAAAELKAKQDAEAKAGAELKAKQDAEAKAALELKAKVDAEAKALADKLAAEKLAASKAESLKKTTITCVKGKLAKKVTAVKPVCPAGYKKK